ncbi:uncharacterized protein F5147DRAFT_580307 [Suillus discolor]|uniref:Uncharacterized protein n=1 Tax=Suillus discolor TaxID=1912936 RepID=A0A9P7F261_9AGAM|nr:uncharacterized protein F5147DRAFT_580307 [Suillus discolor]KAG2103703.1 hypothetical protein F5147DRAFT_580307 [Suillus discolor]
MKQTDDEAPFTGVILPHEASLADFDPRRSPCCTAENFKIDILGMPKSKWNISATKVFARDFVAHHPSFNIDSVQTAFSTHLRSLKRSFKQAGLDNVASSARQKEDQRKERKRSVCICLYHRRLDTACAVSDLHPHITMLMRIGPDGMSSDKTANENNVPQYHILGRHWRSLEVTAWLRVFDVMYHHNRWGPAGIGSRGNNARMRFESMSMGHPQRAVCRLPRNTYRAEWYDSLNQYDRKELDRCEAEVYAFTHVPGIQL